MGVLDAPLILYRRHGASMSSGPAWKRYFANRTFQRRHIKPLQPMLLRLRLLTAAQSMNRFYTAAALADTGTRRGATAGLALIATLLDPTYQVRLKVGLLARSVVGNDAFKLWRRSSH